MLEVVEIITKIKQGMTEPYLCGANDGNQYVVKGNSTLGKGRIVECICGHIGKAFELPIPDFDIIDVPDYLLEYDGVLSQELGAGPAFASMFIPQLQEINLSTVNKLDTELLQDIFLFDYWVKNEDRTLGDTGKGNPNLVYRPIDDQLYVLDHNLAFEDYSIEDMRKSHVGRNAWFGQQMDLFTINGYKDRMEAAVVNLDAHIEDLPDEWFSCSTVKDGLIDSIITRLNSFRDEEFWEPLQ